MMTQPLRPSLVAGVLVAILFALVGCGSEQGSSEKDASERDGSEESTPPAPEPVGEVVRNVELPESSRHLSLAGPGGPVLVPAESADTLVQVGLPEAGTIAETTVGASPHDAAAAPNGRIFVGNELGDTASVV